MKQMWQRNGFAIGGLVFALAALIVGGCLVTTVSGESYGDSRVQVMVKPTAGEYAEIEVDGVVWSVPVPGTGSVAAVAAELDPLRLGIAGGVLASLHGDPSWRMGERKSWSDHFFSIGYPREVAAVMADNLAGLICLARADGLIVAAGG